MTIRKTMLGAAFAVAVAPGAVADIPAGDRRARGEAVIRSLNRGQDQPVLDSLRNEFPFLADAIAGYALGEVWFRQVLDHRTRQIATVAAFAATGHVPQMKIHAGYALNMGVTEEELKEVVYLTTVHAGFPRAIEAAQGLGAVFAQHRGESAVASHPYVGMWVTADGHIRQELLPDGRYDEARGNRKSAYQGRYEVTGSHIDYWDDTGFTADGDFIDGVLHHGGMIFYREGTGPAAR